MRSILPLALPILASCGEAGAPEVAVTNAWARATAAGQPSTAAYMTISNRGSAADRLLSVAAPPPATAALHQTTSEAGVSSMRPLERGIGIAPGSTVELEPLGPHVMIGGLAAPQAPGSTLPLTLRFQHSGERRVEVRIVDAAAGGAG